MNRSYPFHDGKHGAPSYVEHNAGQREPVPVRPGFGLDAPEVIELARAMRAALQEKSNA